MIGKLLILGLTLVNGFFNPSVKLASGKSATLIGQGPPLLFSPGLFGTMPRQFYSELINKLKKNVTVVTLDSFSPISPKDVDDVADSLKTKKLAYMSHSSFNPDILRSEKINCAVLFDPICLPNFNFNGINFNGVGQPNVDVDYPVMIIRAQKLYKTDVPLPDWQEIDIQGDVTDETYENVGHPDILDDSWADVAKKIGLWGTAEGELMNFKEWKYDARNTAPMVRSEYRDNISRKALEFINTRIN